METVFDKPLDTELSGKQNATDNALTTTAKTVVGAINENASGISTNSSAIANLNNRIKNVTSGSLHDIRQSGLYYVTGGVTDKPTGNGGYYSVTAYGNDLLVGLFSNTDGLTYNIIYTNNQWYTNQLATKSEITNNYTDYYVANDYHIRVAIMGKIVVVSGIVFGTGTAGYLSLVLPSPANYSDPTSVTNAVIFYARNQANGSTIQMRCGGDFAIYREASMTSGTQYAFAFSYCRN